MRSTTLRWPEMSSGENRQSFLVELVERKIRSRAQALFEQRGYVDGFALQDWLQAESEVLGKTIGSAYQRLRSAQSSPSPHTN
ncbi:MAG: DUF2934 domain-containing protein [Acidobacteriaceae bacterium]|nr:DUF2934 domain-containing protein [Acidobacteriaceae bacterium]